MMNDDPSSFGMPNVVVVASGCPCFIHPSSGSQPTAAYAGAPEPVAGGGGGGGMTSRVVRSVLRRTGRRKNVKNR